ncbi:MAG: cation:H+ antiporter [Patescibacteria group bacterium]|nr:cation:H+ antiporter [Patescibacteria group bacterium]
MELINYILIFLLSFAAFYYSGEIIVQSFNKIAKFLGWKEFVVSFLLMAFIGSLPNLFVGISSAMHNVPELSLGEVIGGSVIDLTLAIALATLFSKKNIPAKSKTINSSLIFTSIAAVLPILLIWDNILSRVDGIILISFFVFYILWLFSKKDRFTKVCEDEQPIQESFQKSFKGIIKIVLCLITFAVASDMIVRSGLFFAESFDIPIMIIGLFVIALGNCTPEIFFAISTARKDLGWMILGALMGAVTSQSTLVIGTVAILNPIVITSLSPFLIARIFLFIAIFFFFIFVKTDHCISRREAVFLLFIYISFIIAEMLFG